MFTQTSNQSRLDEAAFAAVKAMVPKGVELYLKEPKYLVVGVIFG